ncbi:MAG: hypothetical protein MJE63_03525 [Proteobacteria bacterium]|nr:hypothetical protein [Pseudomonadota bacterium]
MEIKELGKLTKLKIVATDTKKEFEVMFNPTSYSEKFSVEYKERGSSNSGVEEFDYVKSIPGDFQLKITVDGTGVSEFQSSYLPSFNKKIKPVADQVNEFLNLAWYPKDGKPSPLEISWGPFKFACRLKTVTITYTLFDRSGHPLRAELDASFIGLPQQNRVNYEKRFSIKPSESSSSSSSGTQNGIGVSLQRQ